MTRSTIKRNLRIGLVPYPLPLPNSASAYQKILPRNVRAILPKIPRIHPISPSIIKILSRNMRAILVEIASVHLPSLTTIKQRWEPHRNIVGLTLAVNLLAVNLLAVNLLAINLLAINLLAVNLLAINLLPANLQTRSPRPYRIIQEEVP